MREPVTEFNPMNLCGTRTPPPPCFSMEVKGLVVRLSLTVALGTIQGTVRFGMVPPNFEEKYPGGGQGPPFSLLLPSTPRNDLRFDGYLECLHTAKALYTIHLCLLRDSDPGHTAQKSASSTTLSDGWLPEMYMCNILIFGQKRFT
ncbi:hypothetical protein TNCV_1727801 [Trichonephila clavipes]|nr:hypothetical protein TNCV_1727801 [Trichonephila clavipes]